jgi:hypothetical protein
LGCGATTLATLTGITPEVIALENNSHHYSDEYMVKFLRAHGFNTLRLTRRILTHGDVTISHNHVILLSQLWTANEGTWGILFREAYFHNFQIYRTSVLSTLQKPVLSAYIVSHPRWRMDIFESDASA